jgi:hypothetical protein
MQMLSGAIDPDLMRRALDRLPGGPVDCYVLAAARRPGGNDDALEKPTHGKGTPAHGGAQARIR